VVSLALCVDAASGDTPARWNGAPAAGPCERAPAAPAWLDRMQAGLYRRMCLTAARFDGLFGSARFDDEYEATHGSVALGALWSERERMDAAFRFRLRARLPQLSERFDAFIGRDDPEEHATDDRDDLDALPRQFGHEDDDAVLLGLGYRRPARGGGRFDADIGTSLGSSGGPYVKGRYRLVLPFFRRNVLRLRETLFWQESKGAGTTTRIDLERLLGDRLLARWTGSATVAESTRGVRWFSSATLYQNLGQGRALAYQADLSGESRHAVPVASYGLRIVFRRRILREWLFLELRSSIAWPRDTRLEPRARDLGAGATVEFWFGGHETAGMTRAISAHARRE
jgi:hypothetical protein